MLLTFLSLYRLVILPIATCVETITVGTDPKTKKTNPYITKFHEGAGSRPTKCHGKHTCFQFVSIFVPNSGQIICPELVRFTSQHFSQ